MCLARMHEQVNNLQKKKKLFSDLNKMCVRSIKFVQINLVQLKLVQINLVQINLVEFLLGDKRGGASGGVLSSSCSSSSVPLSSGVAVSSTSSQVSSPVAVSSCCSSSVSLSSSLAVSSSSSLRLRSNARKSLSGMGLIEMLIVMTMLALISVGTAYYFTQNQGVMHSSSQDSECQRIAQSGLSQVISLGTRLYGYRIGHDDATLRYNPLFITEGSPVAATSPVVYEIADTSSGSDIGAPEMYKKLYEALTNSVAPVQLVNTGVPLVDVDSSGGTKVGTSVLLVNSVNFLQYLYNSDPDFFTGDGKQFLINDTSNINKERIAFLWQEYLKKYNLKNVQFYIKINPVNLTTQKVIESSTDIKCQEITYDGSQFISTSLASCPSSSPYPSHPLILTHPRLVLDEGSSSSAAAFKARISHDHSKLKTIGNPDLGFQLTIKLKYEKGNQGYDCKAMQRFSHQNRMLMSQSVSSPPSVTVPFLQSSANKNLLSTGNNKQTSCDTHGSNYNDVTMELKFNNGTSTSEDFGTIFLCRGVVGCTTGRGRGHYDGTGCKFKEYPWQRCHEVKFCEGGIDPNRACDQTGTTQANLLRSSNNNEVHMRLKFNDLKDNRRYSLEIVEASQLGVSTPKPVPNSTFYIDATRPTIATGSFASDEDDVGTPTDQRKGRNYSPHLPTTRWNPPAGSHPNKWLQCNTADVSFSAVYDDQFTHNWKGCTSITGTRRDGSSSTAVTLPASNITTSSDIPNGVYCKGTLSGIRHGRHTIQFTPEDTCGTGTASGQLVWDTDLPSTFEAKAIGGPHWSNSGSLHSVPVPVPNKTTAGKLPKHYSVQCATNYCGDNAVLNDGNGRKLYCNSRLPDNHSVNVNGCNPSRVEAKVHHVCGGGGTVVSGEWAVTAPVDKSCLNVRCQSGLICCDGTDCGTGGSKNHCQNPNDITRVRSDKTCKGNPVAGGNSDQDNQSDCPPLGLYSCSYTRPCTGTLGGKSKTKRGYCTGYRTCNNCCRFTVSGQCTAANKISKYYSENRNNCSAYTEGGFSGTCAIDMDNNTTFTETQNCSNNTGCDSDDLKTETRCSLYECLEYACLEDERQCTEGSVCAETDPDDSDICVRFEAAGCTKNEDVCIRHSTISCAPGTRRGPNCMSARHLYQYQYCQTPWCKAIDSSCSRRVTGGSCGDPARGSCSAKDVFGSSNDLTEETCPVRSFNGCIIPSSTLPPTPPAPTVSECFYHEGDESRPYGCTNADYDGEALDEEHDNEKWTWKCQITSNSRNPKAACSLNKKIGICSATVKNTCTSGDVNIVGKGISDDGNLFLWQCLSPDADPNTPTKNPPPTDCSFPRANNSDCDTATKYACKNSGIAVKGDGGIPGIDDDEDDNNDGISDDLSTYLWKCQSNTDASEDGLSDQCRLKKEEGVCDNDIVNGCKNVRGVSYSGFTHTHNDEAHDGSDKDGTCNRDDGGHNLWKCISPADTAASPSIQWISPTQCSKLIIPTCGRCGNPTGDPHTDQDNACAAGEYHSDPPDSPNPDDNTSRYKWTCRNIPHNGHVSCDDRYDTDHKQVLCSTQKPICSAADKKYTSKTACEDKTENDTCDEEEDSGCWIQGPRVNGVCKNTEKYGCDPGTAINESENTAGTHDTWDCKGQNEGTTAESCQKAKTIPTPDCGTGSSNCAGDGINGAEGCCDEGVFDGSPDDTTTAWKWDCKKSDTDDTDKQSCSKNKTPACGTGTSNCADGSSDTAGCCDVGVFDGTPIDTATEWKWDCKKSDTDDTDKQSCSKSLCTCDTSEADKCGNNCTASETTEHDTTTPPLLDKWICTGGDDYQNSEICERPKGSPSPTPACDTTGGSNCADDSSDTAGCCTEGIFNHSPDDTTTAWNWACKKTENEDSTDDKTCSKNKPPACGTGSSNCAGSTGSNNAAGCCDVGVFDGTPIDTATEWKWTCKTTDDTMACNERKTTTPLPACGTGSSNCAGSTGSNNAAGCCRVGVFDGTPIDTTTAWEWDCKKSATDNTDKQRCSKSLCTCDTSRVDGCGNTCTASETTEHDTGTHDKWICKKAGYQNSTTCQKSKTGCSCGTAKNTCSSTPAGCAVSEERTTDAKYEWTCTKDNFPSSETCSTCIYATKLLCKTAIGNEFCKKDNGCWIPESVDGVCKNTEQNGCDSGTPDDDAVDDDSDYYKWHCKGQNGGRTITTCKKSKTGCNCGETRNSCSTTDCTAVPATNENGYYKWTCTKDNFPSSGICSTCIYTSETACELVTENDTCKKVGRCWVKGDPVNGVCKNTEQNGCTKGKDDDDAIADTATHYKWHCKGQNGGRTVTTCEKSKSACVCGTARKDTCNSTPSGCTAKTNPSDTTAPTDTKIYDHWKCTKPNYPESDTCQKAKNGVCDNTTQLGCTAGKDNDDAVDDDHLYYRWRCIAAAGADDSRDCSKAKDGACDNTRRFGCTAGTANDLAVADTDTYYRWRCDAAPGADHSGTCQIAIPPVCGIGSSNCAGHGSNNAAGCCDVGVFHNHPADTTTAWNWTCKKSATDNTDQQSCSKAKPPACGTGGSNCAGNGSNNAAGCCDVGVFHGHPADTTTAWNWTCKKSATDNSDQQSCSKAKPPACGTGGSNCAGNGSNNAAGCCDVGVFHGHPADTTTAWNWTCKKSATDNSDKQTCSKAKPTPTPTPTPTCPAGSWCTPTSQYCVSGTTQDLLDVGEGSASWVCRCGGGTHTCRSDMSLQCGCGTTLNTCDELTACNVLDTQDSTTHYRWRCRGEDHDPIDCKQRIPINGVCDDDGRDYCFACESGTLSFNNADATPAREMGREYYWTCRGRYGGTNSSTCSCTYTGGNNPDQWKL